MYVFHKRKFPKVKSKTKVSFVNETSEGEFLVGSDLGRSELRSDLAVSWK
jgi:hypothetical protein